MLNKIANVVEENAEHLAYLDSMVNGKPIRETMGVDIPEAVGHFRYFAGAILAEEGVASMLDKDTMGLVLHEPIGVVGADGPVELPVSYGRVEDCTRSVGWLLCGV